MAWAVSKKKPDFIGKRSFARPANQDPLRKQLVGLLPVDRRTVLPEGSQIVELHADGQLPPPPVPDARPRHLQLPQRRAGTPLRARPGQGRVGRASARPCTSPSTATWSRSRSPGRCWSTPKEPVAMAELLRTHPLEAWTRRLRAPARTPSASPSSRSSRWSTSDSAPSGPEARDRGWAVDLADDRQHLDPGRRRASRLARPRRVAADAARRRPRRSSRPGSAPPSLPLGGSATTSRPSGRLRLRARGARRPRQGLRDRPAPAGVRPGARAPRPCSARPASCCWPSSDAGDDYVVSSGPSFAGYLADWLLDAALEFSTTHDS